MKYKNTAPAAGAEMCHCYIKVTMRRAGGKDKH